MIKFEPVDDGFKKLQITEDMLPCMTYEMEYGIVYMLFKQGEDYSVVNMNDGWTYTYKTFEDLIDNLSETEVLVKSVRITI